MKLFVTDKWKIIRYTSVLFAICFVFTLASNTSWDEVEKVVKKGVANNIFGGCDVFDIYQGEHIQSGFKSIAFRIKMQDANSTLTDDVIETQMANVRATLKKSIEDLSFRE